MLILTPIADIDSSMAHLVEHRGWSLLHGSASGVGRRASIEKNGVVLEYSNWKGETDYSVKLVSPIHPPVDPELYQSPNLFAVFQAIGISLADPHDVFIAADINLLAVKDYLSDAAVWERGVEAAIVSMNDKYRRLIDGPEIARDAARTLAERHPWLITGKSPTPAEVTAQEPTPILVTSRFRSAAVVAAVGLGLLAARYLA